jgi:hypothetical protein
MLSLVGVVCPTAETFEGNALRYFTGGIIKRDVQ